MRLTGKINIKTIRWKTLYERKFITSPGCYIQCLSTRWINTIIQRGLNHSTDLDSDQPYRAIIQFQIRISLTVNLSPWCGRRARNPDWLHSSVRKISDGLGAVPEDWLTPRKSRIRRDGPHGLHHHDGLHIPTWH